MGIISTKLHNKHGYYHHHHHNHLNDQHYHHPYKPSPTNIVMGIVVTLDPTCVDSPYRSSDQQKILPGRVSESERSLDSSTPHRVHLQGC